MKRLAYEFIKDQFEKEGYTLLSVDYVNAHQKLEYICPKGHQHYITWAKWYSGNRCAFCAGNVMPNFNFIKNSFISEGYVLLSSECKNSQSMLDYICPVGHKHHISWNNWQMGKRCKVCAISSRADNKRTDFAIVKEAFTSEGYTLLSKVYKNCDQKLDYICSEGHRHSISWNDWKYNGSRCAVCANIAMSGPGNPSWKGGISCEPYCDAWADKEYKEDIKRRDSYTCQNPECWGTDDSICLHHVDYNKQNCHPTNLITLCKSCNTRANFNRKKHTKFYNKIIKEIYKVKEV